MRPRANALALPFALTFAAALLPGCPSQDTTPTTPAAETTSPKDSPLPYKVMEDSNNNNSIEYHVVIDGSAKHDDVDALLLKYLYRHLWTRNENEPAAAAAFVYVNEDGYKKPPRSPIATVIRKLGENGPNFENHVPLEFWQEIDQALSPRSDQGFKLARKVERNDPEKLLTLTVPYTEPGKDEWVEVLSFNQAMNMFTDAAQTLFEKVPDLREMVYVGTWKDKEVVRIDLSRADYTALKVNEIDERIGQHHGRAFLELASGRGTDKSVAKSNAALIAKEYRTMLGQLKGKAKVDASLK